MRGFAKGALAATALAAAAMLFTAVPAGAEVAYQSAFGSLGGTAGKLSTPAGLAINHDTGDVYVADRGNNRVEQFTSAGAFVRTWGYDVVQSGADNKPKVNEVSEVRIRATGGTFALIFEGAQTGPLPYDASPGAVQSALNGLTTISASGGSVTVTGGLGDPTGANPYVVTFSGGPLAKTDLDLSIDPSNLGIPPGTQLSCEGGSVVAKSGQVPADSFEYQWLANGDPVAGANAATFTPGPGEAGKAIQCQVTAVFNGVKTMTASRPYVLSSPATSPPIGPKPLAAPTGVAPLGSNGGVPITCNAGTWSDSPTTFTYRWYRNGVSLGPPTTTTATSDDYVLTGADLATRAVFQCAVTGSNAEASSTTISAFLETDPAPNDPFAADATATTTVAASGASKIITRQNGGVQFEVCQASPPSTDVCKQGVAGNGTGQLDAPRSVAVDNSPAGAGAVYAMDDGNPRVQKFSAAGTPLLMIGGVVNQTTDGNLCIVASGDACGGGVLDKIGAPAAFGGISSEHGFDDLGNELTVDATTGNLFAGDQRADSDVVKARVQEFDSGGSFLAQVKMPDQLNSPVKPVSIASDLDQHLYASAFESVIHPTAVERFSPSDFSAAGDGAIRAGNLLNKSGDSAQVAIDPRNERVLVSDRNASNGLSICGGPPVTRRAIIEFDPQLNQIDCSVPSGAGALSQVTGMAVSGAGLLYAAVGSDNTVKVFELPHSTAPSVAAQSATDITSETAQIHAQINPGFENTDYRVEYGLDNCDNNLCDTAAGATLRGLKDVDGVTSLSNLAPSTTYHYRVVAENGLGGDVGTDRTFKTFSRVDLGNDSCANALARKQTKTVGLFDCRAYELASAGFSGGYDVESNLVSGQSPFDSYPGAQDRLLYGVHNGGIPGTGSPTNHGVDPYLATRGADGWSTSYKGIPADNPFAGAPFSSTLSGAGNDLGTLAFSGPQICNPCFADNSSGIPVRLPNGDLVQGMAGSISQPSATPGGHVGKQLSADGEHLIFGSSAQFESAGNDDGKVTIYERDLSSNTTEVVSTLPDGSTIDGADPAGELDVSSNGSRVLIGERVGTDSAANSYWHPYLHIAGQSHSIDLAPTGINAGVLFDGMSADGTKVFFTTIDQLLPGQDTDASADIYEADVDKDGNFSLRLVSTDSTGVASNNDGCTPSNTPAGWNSPTGDGKCGALAFAGGAGLASEEGSFYFLSPEQLEAGKGTANEPNLYVARPGETPMFVATIDTSVGKPGPSPATHPLTDSNFGGGSYSDVEALTVDRSNGDLYAIDADSNGGKLYRYDSSGAPKDFTAGPDANTNTLTGFGFPSPSAAQVAVDNSGAGHPFNGDFYVTSFSGVGVYAPDGTKLGSLDGSGTNAGAFTFACGVAVDQSNGVVYVADFGGFVWRYAPTSGTTPVTDANYSVTGIKAAGMQPCAIAADTAGNVFASQFSDGPAKRFTAASFAAGSPPSLSGVSISAASRALAVDPATDELYVDEGDKITVFDSSGTLVTTIGAGKLACGALGSRGVAVDTTSHDVYASCAAPAAVKRFGYEVPPYTPVDNPAILHAAHAETHSYGDFQVSPDGGYAVFATIMPLEAGYDNAGHYEVYRYDAGTPALDCVSCNPTGAQARSDASLPPNGLGLLPDGRVFFNSGEDLALRDTNGKLDAYEFEAGTPQLISTGNSAYPSGMLGVSSDGIDAFFFTRDVLVDSDRNGQAMKIYDARSNGGFFAIPPPPPCAASDECHGPGTQAPEPPQFPTVKGNGGNCDPALSGCGQAKKQTTARCPKAKVRRNGRCVSRHPHKHRHRHRARKAHAHKRGGGHR